MILEDAIKTNKFSSPFVKAALNIKYSGHWLDDQWSVVFKSKDLSQAQYNVLRILRGQNGKPINLRDIRDRMIQKNSNVTRIIDKLKDKKFVEQWTCEKNRRKVDITITESGMNLLASIDPVLKSVEKDIFKNLSKKEAIVLNDLLDKIRG